jgi:glycosylphosphatidylinositol deacylase
MHWPLQRARQVSISYCNIFHSLTSVAGLIPSVGTSLSVFARKRAGPLMIGALVFSLLPLPPSYGLGTSGTATFAPLAPLVILTATGLVIIIWWILRALILLYGGITAVLSIPYSLVGRSASYPPVHERRSRRAAILSYSVITLVVFLLVPWQVAFLGCWLLHFQTVASSTPPGHARSRSDPPTNIALSIMSSSSLYPPRPSSPPSSTSNSTSPYNPTHLHQHILLLLTMLLPLAASVLAVWARTLITAGLSTPFDGDHNVLYALPFLLLVDAASWTSTSSTANILLHMHHFEREKLSTRWAFALLAAVCFVFGARKTYLIFEFASIAVGLLVLVRVVPRYVT